MSQPKVLFLAPSYPAEMPFFTLGLAEVGAHVIGVGDQPKAALPERCQRALSNYIRVPSLFDEEAAIREILSDVRAAGVTLDRVETLWEPLVLLAAKLREALGVPGLTVEQALAFRDKEVMKQKLDAAGIRTPRHCRASDEATVRAGAEQIGYPLMIKPIAGAGSADTHRLDGPDDLERVLKAIQHVPEVSVEEFVEGREFTFDAISGNGQTLFYNIAWYRPRPLIARTVEWISPQVIALRDPDVDELAGGRAMGFAVLRALEFEAGFTHMEWYLKDDGEVVFGEIGARVGGARLIDQMNYSNDADLFRGWAEAVCYGRLTQPDPAPSQRRCHLQTRPGRGPNPANRGSPGLPRPLRVQRGCPRPAPGGCAAARLEADPYLGRICHRPTSRPRHLPAPRRSIRRWRATLRWLKMVAVTLLGPQRHDPIVKTVLDQARIEGQVAVITGGWEEREEEVDALCEHVERPTVNLRLYHRLEEILRNDQPLSDALVDRNDRLRVAQTLYRKRLSAALSSVRMLHTIKVSRHELLPAERQHALSLVAQIDAHYLDQIRGIHEAFLDFWDPEGRDGVAEAREQVRSELAGCDALLIAGGNVSALLDQVYVLALRPLLNRIPIVAWSAGAMILTEQIVLFHDSPPQGRGDPEVYDDGLALAPKVVALPSASKRLKLDDRVRVSTLARRFQPASCVTLDPGCGVHWDGTRWGAIGRARRLTTNGKVVGMVAP